MELRAFAEQIVFATSLEEKLRCPEHITDDKPGPAFTTPDAPGRPKELIFKPQVTGKAEFPSVHHLERERERGRLLHFFANHELLATELMALVLLRFPDAPAAFRRGVLQTLKDEQQHTRMYIARMKQCGIHFGELPVSGYFWRSVSGMENPMDYVSSLCLTFEQANLDFARHYSQGFATVGDAATAKLLDKIYRDEIGHVAYGLKWFRKWKNPTESDWDAFCRQLKFPLSPQRAKGITLNVEGRRAAGIDDEFIDQLNVYSQSKGRTPNVFVFNPFAEGRIAEGKTFNPTKPQAQLARDLANLPQFLCRQDDIVLVEKRPSIEFLSHIKQAGFPLPEFVETVKARTLTTRKLGCLRPWAWGPDSVEFFRSLFGQVTAEERAAADSFNDRIAQLYSKAWSTELLRTLLSRGSRGHEAPSNSAIASRQSAISQWLCTESEVGVTVDTVESALKAIKAIRARGHHRVVAKEAHGVAGHNAMRFFEPEILPTQHRWLENILRNRRQLVIEPWLDRLMDFSVQLEMGPHGLKLCGFTGLVTDARGQFQANWAETHHHRRIPTRVIALFPQAGNLSGQFLALYADIFAALETELRQEKYTGPIGIDAFVYRAADGSVRLKPIVEINPRYTMGRVMVELMKQTAQGCCGLFQLVNRAQVKAAGHEDFPAYARALKAKQPLVLEGEPEPRIKSGALCLNDPSQIEACLAVFRVGRTVEDLLK